MSNYEKYLWNAYHSIENDFSDPYDSELRGELLEEILEMIDKVRANGND